MKFKNFVKNVGNEELFKLFCYVYLSVFLPAIGQFLGEFFQAYALLVNLHNAFKSSLAARRHLSGQMKDVDRVRYRYFAISNYREQSRFAGTVETQQTVTSTTIQLEHSVLKQFATVESYRERGYLYVATPRMRGELTRTRTRLGVKPGVRFELKAKSL